MTTPDSGRTERIPLFPLGTVLTPGMPLALHVFEPRYRQLVADLLDDEDPSAPEFGVVALRRGSEVGTKQDLHAVGTMARVVDVRPLSDGRCDLSATGERRFAIEELDTGARPYLMATVRPLPERDGQWAAGLESQVRRAIERHCGALARLNISYSADTAAASAVGARALSYAAAGLSSLPLLDRQQLLACPDTGARLSAARAILRRETELILRLRSIPVGASTFRTGPANS